MKEKCKIMDDKINAKIKDIDDTMFLHNQNIERCLVVRDQIFGLQEDNEKLQTFVTNYNLTVNN